MAAESGLKDLRDRGLELAGWIVGFVFATFIIPGMIIILFLPTKIQEGLAVLATIPFLEYLSIRIPKITPPILEPQNMTETKIPISKAWKGSPGQISPEIGTMRMKIPPKANP